MAAAQQAWPRLQPRLQHRFDQRAGDIDLYDLPISQEKVNEATAVNLPEWKKELESMSEFFGQFGDRTPETLQLWQKLLLSRIS